MAEGEEAVGTLRNVSRAGLFVTARELPRSGATLALSFDSPHGEYVDLRGEVRWSTRNRGGAPEGFGVRLSEPPRQFRAFFQWAMDQVGKDDEDETVDL